MPDLSRLDVRYEKGTGDMGSLTAGKSVGGPPEVEDDNYAARFPIEDAHEAIASLRVHFAGGTGTNPLVVRIDSHEGEAYDQTIKTITGGTGTDIQWNVLEDELRGYYVHAGDVVVFTWTNPDPGNMEWGIELALCRCDRVTDTDRR